MNSGTRPMLIVFVHYDYDDFLKSLSAANPGLASSSYDDQLAARYDSLFGTADFYSKPMRDWGHQAIDLYPNNLPLQHAWLIQHQVALTRAAAPNAAAGAAPVVGVVPSAYPDPDRFVREVQAWAPSLSPIRRRVLNNLQRLRRAVAQTPIRHARNIFRPLVQFIDGKLNWQLEMLELQIRHLRPDVLVNQSGGYLRQDFLERIRPFVGQLVMQHAFSELPANLDLSAYDRIISQFPTTIEMFGKADVPGTLLHLGFHPQITADLKVPVMQDINVSFVGNIHSVHGARLKFLEHVAAGLPELRIWSAHVAKMPGSSPLRRNGHAAVYGGDMYRVLQRSKITLNHHGDAPPYASNMRLFEATGVGTMLITDWFDNLPELFEPEKEVVAFRSPEECIDKVRFYLAHDDARRRIAAAGQARCLREHTYEQRARAMLDVFEASMREREVIEAATGR
jgi:spore maturation protein CgeB